MQNDPRFSDPSYGRPIADDRLRALEERETVDPANEFVSLAAIVAIHIVLSLLFGLVMAIAGEGGFPFVVFFFAFGWLLGQNVLLAFWATFSSKPFWLRYPVPLCISALSWGILGFLLPAASLTISAFIFVAPLRWLTGWRCDFVARESGAKNLPPLRPRFSLFDLFEIVTLYGIGIGVLQWCDASWIGGWHVLLTAAAMPVLFAIPVCLLAMAPLSRLALALTIVVFGPILCVVLFVLIRIQNPFVGPGIPAAFACSAIPCALTMSYLRARGWRMVAAEDRA